MLGNIKLNELVLKKCKINKELYYYLGLLWLIAATQSEKTYTGWRTCCPTSQTGWWLTPFVPRRCIIVAHLMSTPQNVLFWWADLQVDGWLASYLAEYQAMKMKPAATPEWTLTLWEKSAVYFLSSCTCGLLMLNWTNKSPVLLIQGQSLSSRWNISKTPGAAALVCVTAPPRGVNTHYDLAHWRFLVFF